MNLDEMHNSGEEELGEPTSSGERGHQVEGFRCFPIVQSSHLKLFLSKGTARTKTERSLFPHPIPDQAPLSLPLHHSIYFPSTSSPTPHSPLVIAFFSLPSETEASSLEHFSLLSFLSSVECISFCIFNRSLGLSSSLQICVTSTYYFLSTIHQFLNVLMIHLNVY